MFVPAVVSAGPRLLLMLLLVLCGSAPRRALGASCPGLSILASSCSCADERSKAHSAAPALGKRVSCSKDELSESPDVRLLPDRTITL
ncbi:hypothetical protein NHX12_029476 [Muraenolepis orangiensis]|uniref:Secreted protein n=1 Tax=Muraenolepis orangiensis TaxID=630683 RepID=A0A9Q0IL99_9TELE|nr:hypothetical protein NHX12_029476 [Muraenolepis orangiensis]